MVVRSNRVAATYIENLLQLIVSLMLLAFSEVVLICKLLQGKFISSHFVVMPFNKFIKLSIIVCLLSNSFLKKTISSCRNLSNNRCTYSYEHSQFSFGGYKVVECHDDVKAECFSKCFLAEYSNFQYLCVPSQLLEEKKMVRFAALISHYLSSHTFHYCCYQ